MELPPGPGLIFLFRELRSGPAAMELRDGPRAAGASGRDLRGRGAIAGLLRTAVGGLRRALYPLTWCSGSGTRRRQQEDGAAAGAGAHFYFWGVAVGAGGDGAQGWTSSCWGERPRPTGSRRDRRAGAPSGWGAHA